MAKTVVNLSDQMAVFVQKANLISTHVGDLVTLNTSVDSDLVGAINEIELNHNNLDSNVGTRTSLTTTDKSDLVSAINEVKTIDSDVGTRTSLVTNNKTDLVSAINEVKGDANGISSDLGSYLRSDAADSKTVGNLNFVDNVRATFGDSNDLEIYHNGANTFIEDNGTGNFLITTNGNNITFMKNQVEQMAVFKTDGACELYHDDSSRILTSATGGTIKGKLDVGSVGTSGGTAGEVAFGGVSGSIDGFRVHNTGGNYLELRPSSTNTPTVLNNVGDVGIGHTAPTIDGTSAGVTVPAGSRVLHVHGTNGALLKLTDPATSANRGVSLLLAGQTAVLNNSEAGNFIFGNGNAEVFRIVTSSGNIIHGKTAENIATAGNEFGKAGYLQATRDGSTALYLNRLTNDGTIALFQQAGNTKGSIDVASGGTTFSTTSDIRLKQDIEPLVATDKLMAMNPVSYNWKADPDGPRSMGFIAQEMQEIIPDAVSTADDDDAMMSMDYGRITPILVSALQDALKRIEELEANQCKCEGCN